MVHEDVRVVRVDAGALRASPQEALRVGDQAEPAATQTVTAPAAEPAAEAGSAKAPAYQPQWDPARQAYLQWHPGKQQWLQFDEPSGEWRPIG